MISFDKIMKIIGFNKFHIKTFIQSGLGGILDGSESICLSLSLPLVI